LLIKKLQELQSDTFAKLRASFEIQAAVEAREQADEER
jgi:hypothetical protein